MLFLFPSHRDFLHPLFLYKNPEPVPAASEPASAKPETLLAALEKKFDFKKLSEMAKTANPETIRDAIVAEAAKYSPEVFKAELTKIADQFIPGGAPEAFIREASERYRLKYNEALGMLYLKINNRFTKFGDRLDGLRQSTRNDLQKLSVLVGSSRKMKETTPAPEKVTVEGNFVNALEARDKAVFKIDNKETVRFNEFKNRTYRQFENYLFALNNRYLDDRLLSEKDRINAGEYRGLAGRFKSGMSYILRQKLDFIFENNADKSSLTRSLVQLRDFLKDSYESRTGKETIIPLLVLRGMDKEAKRITDVQYLIETSENDPRLPDMIRFLESREMLNKGQGKEALLMMLSQFIRNVRANGTEDAFITVVQKLTAEKKSPPKTETGAEKKEKKMSFDEAQSRMRKWIQAAPLAEGIGKFRELNAGVNGGQIEAFQDIPKVIYPMVDRERTLLLERRTIPKTEDARLVADFMSTNLTGRAKLMRDPVYRSALFQSVQNILKHYPSEFSKNHKQSISKFKSTSELTSSLDDPDRPTGHDRTARLLAVLTLAKEAKWVIGNIARSKDFAPLKLQDQFDSVTAEKAPPLIDLRFQDTKKVYRTQYITEAAANGFNGKDIGLNLLKIWAGAVVVVNLMHNRKNLGKALTNPYLLAGAAGVYGITKYQENPEAKRYFFEDRGGQERIASHLGLNKLARNLGRQKLLNFINNGDEFAVMDVLMKEPSRGVSKAKKLVENAQKRATKEKNRYPGITKEDMKEALKDSAIASEAITWSQLPEKSNDRARFLFYQQFLSSPRNIRQLKDNCNKWL